MNTIDFEKINGSFLTDITLRSLIPGSDDKRHSLIKRLLKKKNIIRLKRGVYLLSERYRKKGVDLFQVGQMIYGPSYISLESALSYHGWIPEAVYTITSAVKKRAKTIKTPAGVFSYSPVNYCGFFSGVKRVTSSNGVFLIASPWRAAADYVYVYRKKWGGLAPFFESLRADKKTVLQSGSEGIDEIMGSVSNTRVMAFLEGCKKEMEA